MTPQEPGWRDYGEFSRGRHIGPGPCPCCPGPCDTCDDAGTVPAGPMLYKANGEPDGHALDKPCPDCQES